jgi:hypothetical protein
LYDNSFYFKTYIPILSHILTEMVSIRSEPTNYTVDWPSDSKPF